MKEQKYTFLTRILCCGRPRNRSLHTCCSSRKDIVIAQPTNAEEPKNEENNADTENRKSNPKISSRATRLLLSQLSWWESEGAITLPYQSFSTAGEGRCSRNHHHSQYLWRRVRTPGEVFERTTIPTARAWQTNKLDGGTRRERSATYQNRRPETSRAAR